MKRGGEGGSSSSSSREQRNLREKLRRKRMKHLYSTLASLVSPHRLSIPQMIDQATLHMTQLKERVRALKERKAMLLGGMENRSEVASSSRSLPILHINSGESTVELNLISDRNNKNFMLHELINVLEEEGAEVMSVSLHNKDDMAIYTIIARAIISRIGIETSKIEERLRDIIF